MRPPRPATTSLPPTRTAAFIAALHGVALAEVLAAAARAARPAVTPRGPRGGYPRSPCRRQSHCGPGVCDMRSPLSWIARSLVARRIRTPTRRDDQASRSSSLRPLPSHPRPPRVRPPRPVTSSPLRVPRGRVLREPPRRTSLKCSRPRPARSVLSQDALRPRRLRHTRPIRTDHPQPRRAMGLPTAQAASTCSGCATRGERGVDDAVLAAGSARTIGPSGLCGLNPVSGK